MGKRKLTGTLGRWGKEELGEGLTASQDRIVIPDRGSSGHSRERLRHGRCHLRRGSRTGGQGPGGQGHGAPNKPWCQGRTVCLQRLESYSQGTLMPPVPWSWALAVPTLPGPVEMKVVPTPWLLC